MCGFIGLYGLGQKAPYADRWLDLTNMLAHRGPDGGGWWADDVFFLGHRRLAVIDIFRGSQPMATEDGRLVIVFNGEIYNYRSLREELVSQGCSFRTFSDTEVLLNGYRMWGSGILSRLNGMFAFAIADRVRKEVFLARDRFGEKPLFIYWGHRYFGFCSALGPLAALPDNERHLNQGAVLNYLLLNYVPGNDTLIQGIEKVDPASWILLRQDGVEKGVYWRPPVHSNSYRMTNESLDGAVKEWRELFDRSVRGCLESDVPIGIFLSGGIDSALVAESAMRQGNLSRAYCIDFLEESYGEYGAANMVAQKLGLPLQRVVLRPESLRDFFHMVRHADDPLADSSCLAVWEISRVASKVNKVVLGGDGSDELSAGYLTYLATRMHAQVVRHFPFWVRKGLTEIADIFPVSERKVTFSYKAKRFLRALDLPVRDAHFAWNGAWSRRDIGKLVSGDVALLHGRDASNYSFGQKYDTGLGELLQFQLWDIAEYLPNDILAKTDRMGMAHGLEIRAPFLDHHLAAWMLNRPEYLKIDRLGNLKVMLRYATSQIYGDRVARRPKQGFSIPIHQWIRKYMKEYVSDLLSSTSLSRMGIFDNKALGSFVDMHMKGKRSYGFEIWGILVLAAWHRTRVLESSIPKSFLALDKKEFALM